MALYHRGTKPDYKAMAKALKASWQGYTFNVLRESAPGHVICIGKGVAEVVGGGLRRLMEDNYTVLPQPNARLSSAEHMRAFQTYYRVCSEHCSG